MDSMKLRRSLRFVPAFLALLCAAMPAAASTGRLSFPISESAEGYFLTPFDVNDTLALPAIIDTAATLAMIEARTARRAGIEAPAEGAASVTVSGLLGQRAFRRVEIDHLVSGAARLEDVPAAYNDHEAMPGGPLVIPATAFGGEVLDFDFAAGRFSVYDGRPDRNFGASGRGDLISENGLLFAEVFVNGVRGRALIDTGSPISLMNSEMARASKSVHNAEKTKLLLGATGGRLAVSISGVRTLSVAQFDMRKFDMIVADPPLFDDLGLQTEPAMLIGLDILSLFRVQIDRKRQQLVLTPRQEKRVPSVNVNSSQTRIP